MACLGESTAFRWGWPAGDAVSSAKPLTQRGSGWWVPSLTVDDSKKSCVVRGY